jgi:hypothetical protein
MHPTRYSFIPSELRLYYEAGSNVCAAQHVSGHYTLLVSLDDWRYPISSVVQFGSLWGQLRTEFDLLLRDSTVCWCATIRLSQPSFTALAA